jgi:DNA-binding IclR family transcriptional regulator
MADHPEINALDLIEIVGKHPEGVTAADVARHLGYGTPGGVSGRLSKLASYGRLNRRLVTTGRFSRTMVYTPKGK